MVFSFPCFFHSSNSWILCGIGNGFSIRDTKGARIKKKANQKAVPILPIIKYIPSAGAPPMYISTKKSRTNKRIHCFHIGLNTLDLTLLKSNQGNSPSAAMLLTIATTPINLSGTLLKIA